MPFIGAKSCVFFYLRKMPFACIENATVGTVRTFRLLTVGELYIVYQQQDINNLPRVGLVFFKTYSTVYTLKKRQNLLINFIT